MTGPEITHPLIALLLSGGGGTRLWPLSTEVCPKQFMKLFGAQSLFQQTLLRARDAGASHVTVMANQAQADLIQSDLAGVESVMDQAGMRLILEPIRRDSGPAIAAGVADILARFGPKAQVMVLACDHLIPDHVAFRATIAKAVQLASQRKMVTLGITPTAPVSDYGYIRFGQAIEGTSGFTVEAFVEKPDRARAELYLKDGHYLWNSGMFVFEAGTFADEAARHMPEVWSHAQLAVKAGTQAADHLTLDEAAFSDCARISIDYALFENSQTIAVVPAGFDWSDVGGWSAVHDALPKDAGATAEVSLDQGLVISKDCHDSLLISSELPLLALGVEDLVVVATKQGIFVAPKARAAEIKTLLAQWPQD
jgi:mannose-1-phosphate guanylyltransferase/mannose-6-phosphate isomerase